MYGMVSNREQRVLEEETEEREMALLCVLKMCMLVASARE